jgi:hypothetical protein
VGGGACSEGTYERDDVRHSALARQTVADLQLHRQGGDCESGQAVTKCAVRLVSLDTLMTTVLPAARAGVIFHMNCAGRGSRQA